MGRIVFITGTDTGVGKTLLTTLLLVHLRSSGLRTHALKPFCSGGRGDAELLHALQDGELSLNEVNPYSFPEPVTPLVAARKHRRSIYLDEVLATIQTSSARCDCLLVEGAGGLLAPLGEGFCALDLIQRLRCEPLVVAVNRLGVINHTLLTTRTLASLGKRVPDPRVVLMNHRKQDLSSKTNEKMLRELLDPLPLFSILFLGRNASKPQALSRHHRKVKKVLAMLVGKR